MNTTMNLIQISGTTLTIIKYNSSTGTITDPLVNVTNPAPTILTVNTSAVYSRLFEVPVPNISNTTKKVTSFILLENKHPLAIVDFENLDTNSTDYSASMDTYYASVKDKVGTDTGSTGGTYYEYVQANGTDTENAAELQTAYTTAKSKVVIESTLISIDSSFINVSGGSLMSFFDSPSLAGISLVNGQTYTIILDGVEYTGVVDFYSDWDIFMSSVTAPDGLYSTFSIVTSTIKKSKVVASPGYYNFATDFIADDGNVDIVSLDGNRSVIFNGDGTINVTGDGAYIKGIDVQSKNFTIATDLGGLTVENCKGGDYSFGGDSTFGSNPITVSGTFIDCKGGGSSFGGNGGTASGTFNYCEGGSNSFGADGGTASGTFNYCEGDGWSFGGTASGTFNYCEGSSNSFGGNGGTASGTFNYCKGGGSLFGGNGGTASGTFNYCESTFSSFGGFGGTASGTFNYCIAENYSFGINNPNPGGSIGVLSGKLYYCRQKSGTFQTVSGGGITRYCIDGNNATNNQG